MNNKELTANPPEELLVLMLEKVWKLQKDQREISCQAAEIADIAERVFFCLSQKDTNLGDIIVVKSGNHRFAVIASSIQNIMPSDQISDMTEASSLSALLCLDHNDSNTRWAVKPHISVYKAASAENTDCLSTRDNSAPRELYLLIDDFEKPARYIIRRNSGLKSLFPFIAGMAFRDHENPLPVLDLPSLVCTALRLSPYHGKQHFDEKK